MPDIVHDAGCLAASVRGAHCGCSRSDWLRETIPRWQMRAEVFKEISRWAAQKTVIAESRVRETPGELPVFEVETRRALARMAAAMYIEFGYMARAQADECERIGAAERSKPTKITDVELPLFAEADAE